MLYAKIKDAIVNACGSKESVGIAFSGGVDSTLLAVACRDLGYEVILLTVGFEGSKDMEFASEISPLLGMGHETAVIDCESFERVSETVIEQIQSQSISWIENSIAFYYVAVLAKSLGIRTVLTANGIDELFCGYDSYRRMEDQSKGAILGAMDEKIRNEMDMTEAVSKVTQSTGVKILQPLLSKEFVSYARGLPLDSKIRGRDDMLRKHAIRELAVEVGVPEISARKRKKALQYGTMIHKNLLKSKSFCRRPKT